MNWIEVIQSLGFPILASCACGWYVKYITDKNDEKTEKQAKYYQDNLDKMETRHSEALEKITEALNNNTLALTRLTERLGDEDDE